MIYRTKVGNIEAVILSDGTLDYPPEVLFPHLSAEERHELLRDRGIEGATLPVPYICTLLDTGDQKVLVDTGIGGGVSPSSGWLGASLTEAGISPQDVGVVILTHGHADHIGGLTTTEGELAFPRARHIMWRSEWDFWTTEAGLAKLRVEGHLRELLIQSAQRNLTPLSGKVELVDQDSEVVPGIRLVAAPGHTLGHAAVEVASNGEHLLVGADILVDIDQFANPEWTCMPDHDPAQTVRTRRRLMDRAVDEAMRVQLFHLPFPGLGRVSQAGNAYHWSPEGYSADSAAG